MKSEAEIAHAINRAEKLVLDHPDVVWREIYLIGEFVLRWAKGDLPRTPTEQEFAEVCALDPEEDAGELLNVRNDAQSGKHFCP